MRDKADYRAAHGCSQAAISTVVCLTTARAERPLATGRCRTLIGNTWYRSSTVSEVVRRHGLVRRGKAVETRSPAELTLLVFLSLPKSTRQCPLPPVCPGIIPQQKLEFLLPHSANRIGRGAPPTLLLPLRRQSVSLPLPRRTGSHRPLSSHGVAPLREAGNATARGSRKASAKAPKRQTIGSADVQFTCTHRHRVHSPPRPPDPLRGRCRPDHGHRPQARSGCGVQRGCNSRMACPQRCCDADKH